uniref:Uncharacterized protein n=1 Tax=Chromera velia CCMP2878 TaxID=1169474 RepID=A0A0G4HGA3_9ALVE|eukprot:Cvel_27147.t1-p1 / transcript=Cvel_27147.t1 / gene=Cvel_27147 / organism=Chromera_velia_CCMP2878 / gene_product=Probable indole-3-acetic acid-amido synthetase, putative / transcript_product=Probable indole-3-acetic acid-amido synthetase, putative / location=Cvel_scaffold3340:656-4396(+) / protein_length=654 / sequence_SO=supercontig / SO=protein_coding / is_pseudo=false
MPTVRDAQRKLLSKQVQVNCSLSVLEGVPEDHIVEEFRQRHRLTTFDDYREKIEKAVEAGRAGDGEAFLAATREVTRDPWLHIHCTSGTTGASKYYPFNACKAAIMAKLFVFHKYMVVPRSQTLDLATPGKVESLPVGVILGGVLSCFQHAAKASGRTDVFTSLAPLSFKFAGRSLVVYHLCWLVGLLNFENVLCLSDAFAGNLMIACNWLLENWKLLESEIISGKLEEEKVAEIASEEVKEEIRKTLGNAEKSRREEVVSHLRKAIEGEGQGGDGGQREGVIRRLFPNLKQISCIKTGSMAKYVPLLESLLHVEGLDKVPMQSPGYGGTEGFYGFPIEVPKEADKMPSDEELASFSEFFPPMMARPRAAPLVEEDAYALLPDMECFFEFIPVASEEGPEDTQQEEGEKEKEPATVLMEELEEGKLYELVITNFSGVARHRIGDIIRVVRILPEDCGSVPMVTVVGRSGQALNLIWEKMPEHHVLSAVQEAAGKCGFPLGDFCATESISEGVLPFYHFFVEAKREEGEGKERDSDKKAKSLLSDLRDLLESSLCQRNSPYSDFISTSKVAKLRLSLVKEGTFSTMREKTVAASMTVYSQYKSPTVVRDAIRLAVLRDSVLVTATGAPTDSSKAASQAAENGKVHGAEALKAPVN